MQHDSTSCHEFRERNEKNMSRPLKPTLSLELARENSYKMADVSRGFFQGTSSVGKEEFMKRFLSVLITCLLAVAFAWATPQQPSHQAKLIPVKSTHSRVARRHAHKARRHRGPKHHHHRAV
jgi:hypothetical protein